MEYIATCSKCEKEEMISLDIPEDNEEEIDEFLSNYICFSCKSLIEKGWEWKNVFYGDWKNKFQGERDDYGNRIFSGAYHGENKTIDICVPPSLLDFFNKKMMEADTKPVRQESDWVSLPFRERFISGRSGKGILIMMPPSSRLSGYKFWYASKFLKEGDYGDLPSLSINKTWTMSLFANGGEIKKEIKGRELLDSLGSSGFSGYDEIPKLYIPFSLTPIENPQAIEELMDYE